MNTFKLASYLLVIIFIFSPNVLAQKVDMNRMNRDIKIMESILGELFKTSYAAEKGSNNELIFPGVNTFSKTRGTYLPGYGVIFNISNSSNLIIVRTTATQGGYSAQSFYYSSDESNSDDEAEVSEEEIKLRIQEFLRDYAVTIGQLSAQENVMVVYGSTSNNKFNNLIYSTQNKVKVKENSLPVISASVSKKDLDDYKSSKINESTFNKRIKFSTSSKDKEPLDLKVLSNIFETGLKEVDDESFRISGSPSFLLLDNFGAMFNMNVSYRSQNQFSRFVVGYSNNAVANKSDSTASVNVINLPNDEKKSIFDKKVAEAFDRLKHELREYIVDYGRTVKSIKADQFILVTVNINGINDSVPERLDVQVKKSVFEQLDKGAISREQAINSVVLTEY